MKLLITTLFILILTSATQADVLGEPLSMVFRDGQEDLHFTRDIVGGAMLVNFQRFTNKKKEINPWLCRLVYIGLATAWEGGQGRMSFLESFIIPAVAIEINLFIWKKL
jgi:hypothetical protein